MLNYKEIVRFWFEELNSADWWKKSPEFDAMICDRFLDVHAAVLAAETYTWRQSPEGRLAEVIVLDQFSRNMFRDTPQAFAYDAQALVLAQEAVAGGHDQKLPASQKSFLYMPYMHSESLEIHSLAVELFSQSGMEFNLDFEIRHKKIIERFGRYPHRNKVLGRHSTEAELAFLQQDGSSF